MQIFTSTSSSLLALLLALTSLASSANLEIDKLKVVECDRKSREGDQISVHYVGTLYETGEQFDASYNRGQPLKFQLGAGRVIKGWDQGLLDMCIGEKRKLTIAPELGYGSRAVGPIPANSILIFETELVGIDGVKSEL
ncbi:hypothetical protein DV738_g2721, partial [Chaetothyriales sp. CBS 135597]